MRKLTFLFAIIIIPFIAWSQNLEIVDKDQLTAVHSQSKIKAKFVKLQTLNEKFEKLNHLISEIENQNLKEKKKLLKEYCKEKEIIEKDIREVKAEIFDLRVIGEDFPLKEVRQVGSILKYKYTQIEKKETELNSTNEFIEFIEDRGDSQFDPIINKNKELSEKLQREIIELKEEIFDLRENIERNDDVIVNANDIDDLNKTRVEVSTKYEQFRLNEDSKLLFKNTKITYKATIWNTNFSIPIARFNFIEDQDNKLGNIKMFNSIGAGFGLSLGRMTDYRDQLGNIENTDFANSFSLHLGFLFSAGSENENTFAPTLSVGILDFQIGFGVELGNRSEKQRKGFLTLGYAIPLYKLRKGKYLIKKKGPLINEIYLDY
ncbi:MAG: hypothetical protein N4A59_11170 [Marinifilum sp.]|jgi:hypothetical protein|nr:hypothetical protein [Marinifilum sp.]